MDKLFKINGLRSFALDSTWTIFSQVFIVAMNFATVYVLANLLVPDDYGQFKLVTTWLGIALGVGYTGYVYTLSQKISRGEHYNIKKIYLETFLKSTPTFLGLFIISIYYFLNSNLNLGFGFLFSSFLAPILCVSTLVNVYYMGRKDFKMFALAQNFVDFFQLVAIVFLAYISDNFILIMSGYLVSTLLLNIVIIYKSYLDSKGAEVSQAVTKGATNEEYMQKKLNISGIIISISSQLDKLLIFHFIGAAPLAIYSIVTAVSDQAKTPTKAITSALFPRMTSDSFNKRKLYQSFILLSALNMLIFVFLILLYPTIFSFVFPKYKEYVYLANIASIGILFAPAQIFYLYCQSKGDLETVNTYANLSTVLQVLLYIPAAFLGLIYLLYARLVVGFVTSVYIYYRFRIMER